jgi:cell division protein FtsI (penicillin-binding protein 3)
MSGADIPADPPSGSGPEGGAPPGSPFGGRFGRLRLRRGAPPRDAVPKLEHFHITAAEKRRRETLQRSRERLVLAAGMFALLFAIVSFRVAWVTVLNPAPIKLARDTMPPSAKGPLKPITDTIAPGQRAMIVDRTGQPLALSQPTREAFADPNAIGDPVDVARKLKTVLPRLNVEDAIRRLSDTSKKFVYIERQITPDEEAKINNLGIPSVDFRQTQQRNYPLGRVAAHVLGGVGIDQNGIAGVELAFDQRLRDNGDPLRLSIDVRVQNVVREELLAAKEEFQAIGACGIVMDVNTGEILGLVSLPDFDANDLGTANADDRFDRALSGRYEPGSTFKLQTMSMALDGGVVHIWDTFDAAHDIHIGRFTITDFEGKHRFLALPEVLAYSSNLGAAHIARLVGPDRQQAWLRNMGMFDRVPIQLREADRPQFHSPAAWGEAVNMTVGFGHGISVTPLHVVVGTAAIANGGVLLKPTILSVDPDNPPSGTRVMSPATSDLMRRLMRLVVTNGFGKKAEVAGYYPGGKTGTAEKNSGHGYKKHANVSAFMSVFPMQAPRYAVYMMLDEPHGNASTGGYSTAGQVAAPAAGKVIARVGPILGLMPDTKDAPEIEQALAIPMQPPRGMVLGPVKFVEPTPPPMRPVVIPARVPAEPQSPDLLHRTELPGGTPAAPVAPVAQPPARAVVMPAKAQVKPAQKELLHQTEGPAPNDAEPDPTGLSNEVPARAPRPDLLHHTEVLPVGPLPLPGRPDDRRPMDMSSVAPDMERVPSAMAMLVRDGTPGTGQSLEPMKGRGFRPGPGPRGSAPWIPAKGSGPWNPLMGLLSGEGQPGPRKVAVGPPPRTNPIDRFQRASPFGGVQGQRPWRVQGGVLPFNRFERLRRSCFDGKHVVS